jgi:hypothetical protein
VCFVVDAFGGLKDDRASLAGSSEELGVDPEELEGTLHQTNERPPLAVSVGALREGEGAPGGIEMPEEDMHGAVPILDLVPVSSRQFLPSAVV